MIEVYSNFLVVVRTRKNKVVFFPTRIEEVTLITLEFYEETEASCHVSSLINYLLEIKP